MLKVQCLGAGGFEPVPEKQPNTVTFFSPERISIVEVFCICKMRLVWYHIKNPDLSIAESDACHNCYHKKGQNVPRDAFNKFKRSIEWHFSKYK